jgi:probable rRNA maturation factor
VRNAQRKVRVDAVALQEFAERAFAECGRLTTASRSRAGSFPELDVILVSDRKIAALHRRFMNIAGPTDVMTFQHGEIVISAETARKNGRRFRTATENEIRLYLVHGFLHLLGFDDKTAAQSRKMEGAQNRVLRALRSSNEH